MKDIQAMIDKVLSAVTELYRDKKSIEFLVLVVKGKDIVPLFVLTDVFMHNRKKFDAVLRQYVRDRSPDAIFIVSETFYVSRKEGTWDGKAPSESADRKSAGMLSVETRDWTRIYLADIDDEAKVMAGWRMNIETRKDDEKAVIGNLADFFGTSTRLNVPELEPLLEGQKGVTSKAEKSQVFID